MANGDFGQGDYLVEAKQKSKKANNFRWWFYICWHFPKNWKSIKYNCEINKNHTLVIKWTKFTNK